MAEVRNCTALSFAFISAHPYLEGQVQQLCFPSPFSQPPSFVLLTIAVQIFNSFISTAHCLILHLIPFQINSCFPSSLSTRITHPYYYLDQSTITSNTARTTKKQPKPNTNRHTSIVWRTHTEQCPARRPLRSPHQHPRPPCVMAVHQGTRTGTRVLRDTRRMLRLS